MLANARRSRLERADRAFRAAHAHAPAHPVAWAQLAYVTLARGGDPGMIGDALALSVLTGPNHGGVMPLRSGIAVLAWERLDPGTRVLFERELVKTMRFASQQLVETVRRGDHVQIVRGSARERSGLAGRARAPAAGPRSALRRPAGPRPA